MAEATKVFKTIEKIVTTEEEVITLTLSRDEAEVILALMGRTNSHYSDTPASADIYDALAEELDLDLWGGPTPIYKVVAQDTGRRAPVLNLKKDKENL